MAAIPRGREGPHLSAIDELAKLSRELAEAVHGAVVDFDGFGWTMNPAGREPRNGILTYTLDDSNIFIPPDSVERIERRAIVLPPAVSTDLMARATVDLDKIDVDLLYRESEWVSVRQLIAKPYSALKLDFETLHRGIANSGDSDRVMFGSR